MVAATLAAGVAGLGLWFPLSAYIFTFFGIFFIELIQSVFDIRRNTQTS
jgi:hypothetical protein